MIKIMKGHYFHHSGVKFGDKNSWIFFEKFHTIPVISSLKKILAHSKKDSVWGGISQNHGKTNLRLLSGLL